MKYQNFFNLNIQIVKMYNSQNERGHHNDVIFPRYMLTFFLDAKRGDKDRYAYKVVYFDNIYLMIYMSFYERL